MFCTILIPYFTQNLFRFYVNSIEYYHLITIETQFPYVVYKRNISFMLRKLNFLLLLRQFVVNIITRNIDQVVSMLFFQRRSNANEHTLTKL